MAGVKKEDFSKINDYLWEIPQSFRPDSLDKLGIKMRVPARVYATEKLLDDILRDRSVEQLVNVATLPGIQRAAFAMPDAHEGYGFPIGGVAATEFPDGVISPGGIGYDINCGVRLLRSELTHDEIKSHLERLSQELYREVPSGVGQSGRLKLSRAELDKVLEKGAPWLVEEGYGEKEDASRMESGGALKDTDPTMVSDRAKKRGNDQLGTMGAGNHFVEVDYIDEIYDEGHAKAFGLFQNQAVLLIHTGSRGLGHQVATDYIRVMLKAMPKYGIELPDRELASAPFSSSEGKHYWGAMSAAANFAWANRQLITWEARKAWRNVLGDAGGGLRIVYDVAHNIAKVEEHVVGSSAKKLVVHRKGATRAFGPGHEELIAEYRESGQPVLIPGSMGTASYVLVGTKEGMGQAFGSTCHGAGRRMSRHAARERIHGERLREELASEGIYVAVGSIPGLAEEAPDAYKNIHDVVDTVDGAGIAKKVVRLRPLAVVKG